MKKCYAVQALILIFLTLFVGVSSAFAANGIAISADTIDSSAINGMVMVNKDGIYSPASSVDDQYDGILSDSSSTLVNSVNSSSVQKVVVVDGEADVLVAVNSDSVLGEGVALKISSYPGLLELNTTDDSKTIARVVSNNGKAEDIINKTALNQAPDKYVVKILAKLQFKNVAENSSLPKDNNFDAVVEFLSGGKHTGTITAIFYLLPAVLGLIFGSIIALGVSEGSIIAIGRNPLASSGVIKNTLISSSVAALITLAGVTISFVLLNYL